MTRIIEIFVNIAVAKYRKTGLDQQGWKQISILKNKRQYCKRNWTATLTQLRQLLGHILEKTIHRKQFIQEKVISNEVSERK